MAGLFIQLNSSFNHPQYTELCLNVMESKLRIRQINKNSESNELVEIKIKQWINNNKMSRQAYVTNVSKWTIKTINHKLKIN